MDRNKVMLAVIGLTASATVASAQITNTANGMWVAAKAVFEPIFDGGVGLAVLVAVVLVGYNVGRSFFKARRAKVH